jgi:hypothetical protein
VGPSDDSIKFILSQAKKREPSNFVIKTRYKTVNRNRNQDSRSSSTNRTMIPGFGSDLKIGETESKRTSLVRKLNSNV